MANKKISQLTERTKLTGNEMLPFQEGNSNGKIRSSLITSLIEDLRFEISDIINETNALNNYLSNASFSNNLDKWQYGNNIKVFRVSQKLLYFNNNFYSNKEAITALTKENNRNAVELKNSYIMQYNTDYDRHPEFNEKVARLFNIQFRYKVLRPGILTIYFKNEDTGDFEEYEKINYTQQLNPTSIFNTLKISGKWNGTGDFYLSFTGEILIHSVILYDDDLGNLNEYINGQLQITNEKIQANYDKIIETSNKLEEYHSEFLFTAEELRVSFEHSIEEIDGRLEEYRSEFQLTAEQLRVSFEHDISEVNGKLEKYHSEFRLTAEELNIKFDHNISEINGKLEEYHSEFTLTAEQLEIKFDKKITDTKKSITSEYTSLIELTAENLRVEFGEKITNVKDEITEEYTSAINLSAQKLTVDFTKKITNSKEEITKEYTSAIELTAENLRVEFDKKITNTKNEITEEYTSAINLSAEELTVDFNKKITDAKQEITSEYTSAIELSAEELTITFDQKVTHLDETLEEYHSEFTLSAQEFTTRFEKNEESITGLEESTEELTQTTTSISTQVSEISQDLDSITLRVASTESNITTLVDKTNGIEEVNNKQEETISSIKLSLDNINLSITQNSTEIKTLKNTTSNLQQTTTNIQKQVSEIDLNIDSISLRVSNTEQDIVTITDKTDNLEQTDAKQQEDISQIKLEIGNINLSVSSNTNEISSLKNKTTGLEQTTQTITKQISEINLDIDSITLRVSKNESTITNLEGKTNTVSSDVTQIKLDTEKIESNVTSISSKVDSNTGRIESLEAESAGWVTTAEGNTLWAAKGQTEADIKAAKDAAEDAASDAYSAYSKATNAENRANNAYNLADDANDKATANATAIKQTSDYISLISGNFDSDGDIINAAGWVTTSEANTLWVRKDNVISSINQTAESVEINAEKIDFVGKTVINGKFIVDTSGNVTLNNLTANDGIFNGEINAISGSIGDFIISDRGLYNVTSDSTDPGASIDISNGIGTKSFKANSIGSSSMCEIRSDNSVVLQLTSYGKDGVGLFILCNDAGRGYAIQSLGNSSLEARSGETITIHGLCLNYRTIANTAVINTNDDFILFKNNSSITVSLLGAYTSPGKIIYFKQAGNASVTIKGEIMRYNSKTITTQVVYNGIYSWFYISDGSKWVEFSC